MQTEIWGSYQLAAWVLSMGNAEIDWLKAQAAQLPPNPIIVNIGAAAGVSTLAMLEERTDALIYSCEIDLGAGEMYAIEKAGLDKSRVIRLGRSQIAGRNFHDEADFIFVDGGHTASDVVGDIYAWMPCLRDGAVIAFHDYGNPNLPDVKDIVDQLMAGYPIVADVDTIRAFRNK